MKPRQPILLAVLVAALMGSVLLPRVQAAHVPDVAGCPGSDDVPRPEDIAATRAAVLCTLNSERAKAGLPALRRNGLLELSAQLHSEDMGTRKFFEHVTPDGVDPQARITAGGYAQPWTGENLYWGEGPEATPTRALEGWMTSPGHRENILRPQYTEVGVGIAYEPPRRGVSDRVAIYTTNFGGG